MYQVLLVDDDPFVLDGLPKIVDWAALGLEIAACMQNGADAMQYMESHPVDILLTDIKMPGISGIELIRWIRQKNLNVKCIVLSGHDDYPYMQQAIQLDIENYLIKSINEYELTETLQNTVQKLKRSNGSSSGADSILYENVLYRWLNGRIEDKALKERAALLGIDLNSSGYRVCILRLDPLPTPQGATLEAALSLLAQALQSSGCRPQIMRTYGDDLALLFFGEDALLPTDALLARIMQSGQTLRAKLGCTCFFAVGDTADSYQKVHKSYRQASVALGYSSMLEWPLGLEYHMEMIASFKEQVLCVTAQEEFRSMLLYNDANAVGFVEAMYKTHYTVRTYAPDYLQNTTLRLAGVVAEVAVQLGMEGSCIFDDILMLGEQVIALKTRQAHCEWLTSAVKQMLQLQSAQPEWGTPVILRVANYVNNHYMDAISLKQLAQRFNMNSAYLGRIFKEERNDSFSNYVNKLRIEKAKELLRKTSRSISEIGRNVGYPNPNHFISTFRKYQGCLPGEYRKR